MIKDEEPSTEVLSQPDLIEFAHKSTDYIKYEKKIEEKPYLILEIGYAIKERKKGNIWPIGIYLMIEKNTTNFPLARFKHLYTEDERKQIEDKTKLIIL